MGRPETEATRLLERFGVTAPPVPVERLAKQLGIAISFESVQNNISGMLYRDGERATIGVNSHHAKTRQRFTVAHEIGHFLLHPGKPMILDEVVRVNFRDDRSSMATDAQEIAANRFGAELLMPARWVLEHVDKRQRLNIEEDEELSQRLATKFQVSAQAMHFRLANLGLLLP